jgi:hypothetical protein
MEAVAQLVTFESWLRIGQRTPRRSLLQEGGQRHHRADPKCSSPRARSARWAAKTAGQRLVKVFKSQQEFDAM